MTKSLNKLLFIISLAVCLPVMGQDTFADNFGSVSYSNTDGNQSWSTNWLEYNDNNSASNGYIRITGGELFLYYLWNENIRRSADLSGYSAATLTFDWRTSSLESGETLSIEVSSDGSSFTTLDTFSGSQTGSFSQDISAYMSANTTIRFIKGGGNWSGSNDRAYIDNVLITATSVPLIDTDGDGAIDVVDLDDDNDGITDEEEYCSTVIASFLASSNVGERNVVINHTDTGYLRIDFSSMDNSFQLDINGNTVHPSILEFENGALDAGDEYFVFQSDGSFISQPWVANSNGIPRLRLIVDEYGEISLYGSRNTSSTSLELMEAQGGTPFNTIAWIPGNNNTFTLTNQQGPGPEGFTGELFASAICDTDGDGISNHLDLDSDNDGIFDLVESGALEESGVNDNNNDGRIDGAVSSSGANGIYSGIEDNDTAYALLTYTIFDSDSDGTYDAYTLDADGDGCTDVVESGFTDNNDDGLLGPNPVTINSEGMVTSGSDGYSTPNDNDSNSTFDYREVGTAPIITSQPVDVTTCPGCTTSISAIVTADQFQWQYYNGSSWVNLSDTGIYSGTSTNVLTITNPTPNEHNTPYRLLASNDAFVCGATTSNTTTLRLQVNTVITNRRVTYRVNKN
ncbi:immunoglobulin domain-containing protein [Flagellimonas marinaquae]|uniref:immunoglobulin domain-containing protein n=1 Tax=Flagellimonas marinaquae TaxID=254955 RepID=UPI000F8C5AC4|nr:immunoglobulin domain-containing protein [Allomuricauda aquimarina]